MFVKYDNLSGPDLHAQRLRQGEIKRLQTGRKTARFCNDGNLLAFKETVARHPANSLPPLECYARHKLPAIETYFSDSREDLQLCLTLATTTKNRLLLGIDYLLQHNLYEQPNIQSV